jgi:hypothetical protein
LAIFIAVAFLGFWLLRRRATALKALGNVVLFTNSSMAVLLAIHVPRWGVFRLGSETDLYPASAIRIVYIVLIGGVILARVHAYWRANISRRLV